MTYRNSVLVVDIETAAEAMKHLAIETTPLKLSDYRWFIRKNMKIDELRIQQLIEGKYITNSTLLLHFTTFHR